MTSPKLHNEGMYEAPCVTVLSLYYLKKKQRMNCAKDEEKPQYKFSNGG